MSDGQRVYVCWIALQVISAQVTTFDFTYSPWRVTRSPFLVIPFKCTVVLL